MATSNGSRRRGGVSVGVTYFLIFLTAGVLLWRGWTYYPLVLDQRPDHEDFRTLRPSGHLGYGYGVAGAFLILTNLLYLARRKLARFQLGSMATWLDLHVLTGLLGAIFVAFHSSFQLRNPIATTTAISLAVAVGTGLIGRFLHAFVPRLDLEHAKRPVAELDALIPGVGLEIEAAFARHPVPPIAPDAGLLAALTRLSAWRSCALRRQKIVMDLVYRATNNPDFTRRERKRILRLGKKTGHAARAEVRGVAATAILRSWRSLHRFFAILMVLAVAIHIGVAWYYGYRWIFSD